MTKIHPLNLVVDYTTFLTIKNNIYRVFPIQCWAIIKSFLLYIVIYLTSLVIWNLKIKDKFEKTVKFQSVSHLFINFISLWKKNSFFVQDRELVGMKFFDLLFTFRIKWLLSAGIPLLPCTPWSQRISWLLLDVVMVNYHPFPSSILHWIIKSNESSWIYHLRHFPKFRCTQNIKFKYIIRLGWI